MLSELDALRTAKLLLDQHGVQEAWRILMGCALDEYLAGKVAHQTITQQVLSALHKLTRGSQLDKARH